MENTMKTEDDAIKILPVGGLPEVEQKPSHRLCPKCGRMQVLSGYFDYSGYRHWVYLPGACVCWETVTVKEPIK